MSRRTIHGMLRGREIVVVDVGDFAKDPTALIEWARWYEVAENRQVALTEIRPGVRVSTVFLGVASLAGEWFETAVFGGPMNGSVERARSLIEAELVHEGIVKRAAASDAWEARRWN